MIGQVVWHNPERLFGFIENSQGRWFFHESNVVAGFKVGLGVFVEFDLAEPISLKHSQKHAIHIRPADIDAMVEGVKNAVGGAQ